MDWKKRRPGLRERSDFHGRVRAGDQAGREARSIASHGDGGADCAGKSIRGGGPSECFGGLGFLTPKVFWVGIGLIGFVALGLSRSGEVVSVSELKAKGDLFYRKGESEPFTGMAEAENKKRKTEAEFWQGRMHGRYRSWFSNGQLESESYFEEGVREGIDRRWNPQGQILQETRFQKGLMDGARTEWYANGKVERKTNWQKGKRQGEIETWFEDGTKKGAGNFKDGERDGTFVVWWENGNKRQETNYKMGVSEGWSLEWGRDGKETKKAFFVKGKATEGPAKG